jgi:site-specific DNA-methyltransferase (adenine-specific)
MNPKPITSNTLFYGDNLPILRDYIPDESVDLVYLDPPFNSQRAYNVSLRDKHGQESDAQVEAFKDFWTWDEEAAAAHDDLMSVAPANVVKLMDTLKAVVGERSAMRAYLTMMTARLLELRRVLKPTGSLYLHCDPTASHYLKMILDTIFGVENFVNEIVWKRSDAHSDAKQGAQHYGRVHDVLLFYAKSQNTKFNAMYRPLPQSTIENWYRNIEPETGRRYNKADVTGPGGASKGNPLYEWKGITRYWRYSRENMEKLDAEGKLVYSKSGMPYEKRYLDESKGVAVQDWWDDIQMLRGITDDGERMGYPTQKPLALLERIIQASSNEGDIVIDPFCGCGTAVVAAQKLNRKWIGIDITHLSIALMKYRLLDNFDLNAGRDYTVIGEPQDLASAQALLEEKDGRYQFQWWALSLIGARPLGGEEGSKKGKKGSDRGVDGYLPFYDSMDKTLLALVQVKSGHVQDAHIQQLLGALQNESAPIGIFLTLESPSRNMIQSAANAGLFESQNWGKFPRLQILTIEELLAGKKPSTPPLYRQKAGRIHKQDGQQGELGI